MEKLSTKEKILFSALDLFAEKGYDGVGVDLIASRVGIKGPSLYRYFKGKEEILATLVLMVDKEYDSHFGPNGDLDAMPKTLDELIAQARESILFTMHNPMLIKVRRILSMEQFRNEQLAKKATKHSFLDKQRMYEAFFTKLIEEGQMKKDDPNLLALEFVSPLTLILQVVDRQPDKEKEMIELMNHHFYHFKNIYGK